MQRILALIDYANLAITARAEFEISQLDLLALGRYLVCEHDGRTGEVVAFCPSPKNPSDGLVRYFDFLRYNGLEVITKTVKDLPDGSHKGNCDIDLALFAVEAIALARPVVLVIGSHDGDFAPLATYARRRGIRVEVAGFGDFIAGELRRAANSIIDLSEILDVLGAEDETAARGRAGDW